MEIREADSRDSHFEEGRLDRDIAGKGRSAGGLHLRSQAAAPRSGLLAEMGLSGLSPRPRSRLTRMNFQLSLNFPPIIRAGNCRSLICTSEHPGPLRRQSDRLRQGHTPRPGQIRPCVSLRPATQRDPPPVRIALPAMCLIESEQINSPLREVAVQQVEGLADGPAHHVQISI